MPQEGELTLQIGADTDEAQRAVDSLDESLEDMGRTGERSGEQISDSAQGSIRSFVDLEAAISFAQEALTNLIGQFAELRGLAQEFADETAQTEQVAAALNISPRAAQTLVVAGQAAGVDPSALRGFFDPIQEFQAFVESSPFATDADRERLADLQRLGFDTQAIARGGTGAITGALQTLAGLSVEEQAQLPALGVSITDVQELRPFAQRLQSIGGGDVAGGLNQIAGRLPTPLDADEAFVAALNAEIDERFIRLADEVRSGSRPGGPFGRVLNTVAAIPLIGDPVAQAAGELANLAFGPSDVRLDGESVGRVIRNDADTGRNSVTGGP